MSLQKYGAVDQLLMLVRFVLNILFLKEKSPASFEIKSVVTSILNNFSAACFFIVGSEGPLMFLHMHVDAWYLPQ